MERLGSSFRIRRKATPNRTQKMVKLFFEGPGVGIELIDATSFFLEGAVLFPQLRRYFAYLFVHFKVSSDCVGRCGLRENQTEHSTDHAPGRFAQGAVYSNTRKPINLANP